MRDPAKRSISELMQDIDLITAAINRGVREAVLDHIRVGNPVCVAQDGKVVWLSPEEALARLNNGSAADKNGAAVAPKT